MKQKKEGNLPYDQYTAKLKTQKEKSKALETEQKEEKKENETNEMKKKKKLTIRPVHSQTENLERKE